MSHDLAELDWWRFTGRSAPAFDPAVAEHLTRKRILITGAGGSIGSALARSIASRVPAHLLLLDQAEAGLADLQRTFALEHTLSSAEFIVGDIRDESLLRDLLSDVHVDLIFHAAACKHLPLLETNLLAAADINALGTRTLLRVAEESGVRQFVLLSTDKAVDPSSVLGVSKRIGEIIALCSSPSAPEVKVVRLCNVLGSTGSVAPIFAEHLRKGTAIRITDAAARRYFITESEAVHHLLHVLLAPGSPCLWAPRLQEQQSVESLAQFLSETLNKNRHEPFMYTGLRPGEKLSERLISDAEQWSTPFREPLVSVRTPLPETGQLSAALDMLSNAVARRDLADLVSAFQELVPFYQPSNTVRALLASREGVAV